MTEEKTIRITCEAATMLPLAEFEQFQDSLKWLEEKQYEKLKQSIVKDGFHDPIHVWKKHGEKKPRKMLDGHQRINTIGRMIGAEKWKLPGGKLPIVWVIAKTEKQAKRIILEKMSQYGKYDEDSIYKFVHEAELEWPDAKEMLDFPSINMGTFEQGWMNPEFESNIPGQVSGNEVPPNYRSTTFLIKREDVQIVEDAIKITAENDRPSALEKGQAIVGWARRVIGGKG